MENLPNCIQLIDNELWFTENDRSNLKISYRINEVVFTESSPFQHIMILDSYDFGRMLILDGVVQTTEYDGFVYNEMIAHVPIYFHSNPQKVLIIGGGDCGVVREVSKYSAIEQIDMVEIDELVTKVCKKYLKEVSGDLDDPRINYIFEDGYTYVNNHKNFYDVIIIDSSDPIGPAEQLFGLDFYKKIYTALKDDGIMVCQSESPIFYFDVLEQTFEHVSKLFPITKLYTATIPTYPGGLWSFTLGSKKHQDLVLKLDDKNTKYINSDILKTCFILPQWLKNKL